MISISDALNNFENIIRIIKHLLSPSEEENIFISKTNCAVKTIKY
jgi:hypothetical protein